MWVTNIAKRDIFSLILIAQYRFKQPIKNRTTLKYSRPAVVLLCHVVDEHCLKGHCAFLFLIVQCPVNMTCHPYLSSTYLVHVDCKITWVSCHAITVVTFVRWLPKRTHIIVRNTEAMCTFWNLTSQCTFWPVRSLLVVAVCSADGATLGWGTALVVCEDSRTSTEDHPDTTSPSDAPNVADSTTADHEAPCAYITIENSVYAIPRNSRFMCSDISNCSALFRQELRRETFDLIVMDPPWQNKRWGSTRTNWNRCK